MHIHVSDWLKTNGLDGYLRIEDAQPHPQADELIKQINIDKFTVKLLSN